jgi:ABC-type branched-subunit amino acid transport system substrate-binding protein
VSRFRWIAGLSVVVMLATACGQRPGVFRPIAGAGGTAAGAFTDSSAGSVDGQSDQAAGAAGGASAGAAEVTGAAGQKAGGAKQTVTQAGQAVQSGPVWGNEITIGIHAPVTGAASLKSSAFDAGKELYWKWLADNGKKVNGRTVKVEFADDQYNPSHAADVCKQMVEAKNAFLLIGAAGADQIVECARYSASRGVPYLSAGVTENVVSRLKNYYALSMSYPAQGPLLVDHLKELEATDTVRPGTSSNDPVMRVGLIYSNTPNFADAADAFQKAFQDKFGRRVDYVKVVSKEPNASEAAQQATAIQTWPSPSAPQGIDVVYVLSSVTFLVNLTNSMPTSYRPRFVGIGITMVNQGVDLMCVKGEFQGAHYFNPFPAWVDRNKYDTDYDKAVQKQGKADQNTALSGDLMWTLWSLSRVIHSILEAAGPQLTRGGFMKALDAFRYSERKAYPDLQFSPDNHFGARSAHLLEAKCENTGDSRGQFHQLRNAW